MYAELDTTLEGVLDVIEIIEGLFKVYNIDKTNVNIKCVKVMVIFAIFKTLDTIDEFYIVHRMDKVDITPIIQDNNTAKIYKRHFKTFLVCFKEALY